MVGHGVCVAVGAHVEDGGGRGHSHTLEPETYVPSTCNIEGGKYVCVFQPFRYNDTIPSSPLFLASDLSSAARCISASERTPSLCH